MNENNFMKIKHPRFDSNIEEFVRDEMRNSMISNLGIPRSFSRPKFTIPYNENINFMSMNSKRMNRQAKSSQNINSIQVNKYVKQQASLLLHKHSKIIEKLNIPCDKSYYEKIPIKPGFLFFDCLIKAPKANINQLEINIPESIYYSDKMYFLHTLENNKLNCSTEIFCYKFMKIVESFRSEEKCIYDKVAGIMRGRSEEINNMQKIVLDWNQFKVKMIGNEFSPYSLVQRYIHAPGHRPAITRLYYFSYMNDNKANYAYFINNIQTDLPDTLRNIQKCVVNTQDPSNIQMFTKSGTSIKGYEKEAKKIVMYLNKGYNTRITEIVLDFVTDSNGKIWLISCKGLKIDETTLQYSLAPLAEWWPDFQKTAPKKPENEYLMNFVHCKLCRLYYTNNELSHLVSIRMLMLFKIHSLRRIDLPLDTSHLKVTSADMLSQSIRICQYCYMLVTSEFELLTVEESLAKSLNVPKKEISYEEDPKLEVQKHFLPKKLLHWRLLVYISKIFDYKISEDLSFVYLHLKFGEIITRFKVKIIKNFEENEEFVSVDLMKLHFFFSNEHKTLEKLIQSKIIEFRITATEKYSEKILCASHCSCLLDLPFYLPINSALYTKKQILLFDDEDTVLANLSVYIGLSCDKLVGINKIKVALNKMHDVYIPDIYYMSTDPLPIEWMELLGEKNQVDESFGKRIDDSEFYRPIMTKAEMLRMEDITSPYKVVPKIYSENQDISPIKKINHTNASGLSVYKVVNEYLKVKKPKHAKVSSWSGASTKRSRKTADTSRGTPIQNVVLKHKMEEIYKEIME